tara:strand:+ start:2017 stop:2292 length:276 start_codon:yes stop_codon:yes gene_type:complete
MADKWKTIDSDVPYDTPVQIRFAEGRKVMLARLLRGHSLDESMRNCDQWVAEGDDYPPCWTEGACWESNHDEVMSKQPAQWRPAPKDASHD